MSRWPTWTIWRGCTDSVGKFPRPWMGTASPTIESKRRTWSQVSTQNRRLCSGASPRDMVAFRPRLPKIKTNLESVKERSVSRGVCPQESVGESGQKCGCERWMLCVLRCAPLQSAQSAPGRFIRGFKASSLGCALRLAAVFGHWLWTPCLQETPFAWRIRQTPPRAAPIAVRPARWQGFPSPLTGWAYNLYQLSCEIVGFYQTLSSCVDIFFSFKRTSKMIREIKLQLCKHELRFSSDDAFLYLSREYLQNMQDVFFAATPCFTVMQTYRRPDNSQSTPKKEKDVRGLAVGHFSSRFAQTRLSRKTDFQASSC